MVTKSFMLWLANGGDSDGIGPATALVKVSNFSKWRTSRNNMTLLDLYFRLNLGVRASESPPPQLVMFHNST